MSLPGKLFTSLVSALFRMPARGPVAQSRTANVNAWGKQTRARQPAPVSLRVAQLVEETADTRSIWLVADTGDLPAVAPGQFFTCVASVEGQTLKRAYSLANVPAQDGRIRLTVKRLAGGQMSTYLHNALKVGDTLTLAGPSGDFVLPPTLPAHLVMIAGGSGITPIRSLLESALRQQRELEVTLYYACRNEADMIFRDELQAMTREYPNFRLIPVFSAPAKGQSKHKGRMTVAWCEKNLALTPQSEIYVCGPEGLMAEVETALQNLGVDRRRLHLERFLPAAHASAKRPTTEQRVRFARSGVEARVAPGQSLLEAGLAAGVALEYSCQVGGCGHCRVKVTDGHTVSDEPNCLSEAEQAQGYRLACLSYACDTVTVDA